MATQPGIGLRRRVFFLLAFCVVFSLVLVGRLAHLQFVRGAELREKAFNVRVRPVPIEARRGVIYDRMGRELAVSVNVDSIFAVPSEVDDPPATAQRLAEALDLDYEWVLGRLIMNESFVWISRKVSDEVSQVVKMMGLSGIGFTQESRRVYPKGSLAAHVLGFAGIDSQGLGGVEYSYDRQLRGTPGSIVIEYDAIGHQIPQAMHRYFPPTDGQVLVLTIDEVIQSMVERELDQIMLTNQPKHATILVMDPDNGEILALGCRPSFDPNHFADYPEASWRNFAVSDTYHPGSTFKPVTAAAAVEAGVVSWDDHFACGGSIGVEDRRVNCHRRGGHGSLDLTGVIEYSCNVGFVQIGLRLGIPGFYEYWHALGLDSATGIDLPGEAVSLLMPEKDCRPIDLAVMSFGQTLTVTPLELARAMAAICNGGYLVTPHVGKELRSPDGKVAAPLEWPRGQQVLSTETSREVSRAMEAVVRIGTGKAAYMPGYRLAGKTGTSQKTVGGVVSSSAFVSSFCGFGPAEDPEVLILVVVDEPQGAYYGSQVAAPPFGRLMRDIYRYLEIPLVYSAEEEEERVERESRAPSEVTVPGVIGRPLGEALALLQEAGLRAEVSGGDGDVAAQTPGPNASVPPGTLVLLEVVPGGPSRDLVVVPDVTGRSMAEAALLLEKAGLLLTVEGSGMAAAQNPTAGTAVAPGTAVRVVFEPPASEGAPP
ncbi:MAG: PASTA domain-containing protein [Bacillota bacterium]|nr:MAG: PASTA domain-containing protein [Bacillota bacterium]